MAGAQDGFDLLLADLDGKPDDTLILARVRNQPDADAAVIDYREFMFSKVRLLTRKSSRPATVTTAKLNVRTGAGVTFPAVAQLVAGAVVQVVDADVLGWLRITEGEHAGRFISSQYVSFEMAPA